MSEVKGKILLVITCIIAVALIAASVYGGFKLGDLLQGQLGTTLVAYNWNAIKIGVTAGCGVLMALLCVPACVIAGQVGRMYNIGRKYARWTPVSIIVAVLIVLLIGAATFGVCYEINQMKLLIQMLLHTENMLLVQIGAGACTVIVVAAILMPLLLCVRVSDSVGALNRKKRARSYEDD